jgi:hypothetical protein
MILQVVKAKNLAKRKVQEGNQVVTVKDVSNSKKIQEPNSLQYSDRVIHESGNRPRNRLVE